MNLPKEEIKDVIRVLNLAISELADVLETDDLENQEKWTARAISLIQNAEAKLQDGEE